MKRNRNAILLNRYLSKINQIARSSKEAQDILSCINDGRNSYMRLDRIEASSYDMSWIKAIEDCIFDLGDIVSNPRENTKSEANLVPVELARKTTAESVRHLASHTQFIKDIDEKGNVIPSKILNIANEQDLHTYENRFIATLIRRLVIFIEKRYDFAKNFAPLHDEEILYYRNTSNIEGAEVEVETKVNVAIPPSFSF